MIRKILSFVFLFNLIISNLTGEEDCNEYFEEVKSLLCHSLVANDNTETCLYSNNKCTSGRIYTNCEEYKVDDGQTIDSKKCSSINLPAGKEAKMCEAQTNKCVEVDRKCKDYVVGGAACSSLQAGDEKKRCLLFNNKCEAHYKKCEDITSQSECSKNLPLSSEYTGDIKYSKCFWDTDSSCKPAERKCSEYKNYEDYLQSNSLYCKDLKTDSSSNNICILDSKGNCYDALGDCTAYKGKEETECIKYKPIDTNTNLLLNNYKCAIDTDEACVHKPKECSDYKEGEVSCQNLITKDSSKTYCGLDNNKKCVEKYKTCSSYNDLIPDTTKRKSDECTAIVPVNVVDFPGITVNDIKCVFEGSQCKEKKKECKEYNTKSSCESHSSALDSYSSKICVFKKNECKEQYNTCEDYEESGEEQKTKDVCESILEDSLYQKCVFTDNGNGAITCRTKTRGCNEFSLGKLQNLCTEYNSLYSLKHNEKCVYNNGVCTQTARNCVDILIDSDLNTENKEKLCNSGITGKNKICTLNGDKNKCIEKENPNCEKCPSQNSSDNNNDQNSGKEIYLNKLLILILCLLL